MKESSHKGGVGHGCLRTPPGVRPVLDNREFKQIATATSTMAVVDAVSWGEYVS